MGDRELEEKDVNMWGVIGCTQQRPEPPRPDVVAKVEEWIRVRCEPLSHIRRKMGSRLLHNPLGSYGWKHAAESASGGIGEYVANGEFIVAALRAGYRAAQVHAGSPNALFNMRARRGAA